MATAQRTQKEVTQPHTINVTQPAARTCLLIQRLVIHKLVMYVGRKGSDNEDDTSATPPSKFSHYTNNRTFDHDGFNYPWSHTQVEQSPF
ncbi:hypothetical protein AVEN_193841-1 [Araneus ventricosus]|uniref:Uncharacterized protein n=1 Tax=Araneus ventricosus TaxID=182803 RepID=A0A4Y2G6K0_ARAVE|nr:hypothetical protein AVEN_193841-1 [Araneus ventricosus]